MNFEEKFFELRESHLNFGYNVFSKIDRISNKVHFSESPAEKVTTRSFVGFQKFFTQMRDGFSTD